MSERSGRTRGTPILGLVCAGLLVFAAYSVIEGRFRDVSSDA